MSKLKELISEATPDEWYLGDDGKYIRRLSNKVDLLKLIFCTESDAELVVCLVNNAEQISDLIEACEEYIKICSSVNIGTAAIRKADIAKAISRAKMAKVLSKVM